MSRSTKAGSPASCWRDDSGNQIIHDLDAWREQEYKSRIPCQLLA
ncbi:hypothetical protein [Aeromonas rivipollensis]|nr:hypothetical protein [Aeromonas rivipollensis]